MQKVIVFQQRWQGEYRFRVVSHYRHATGHLQLCVYPVSCRWRFGFHRFALALMTQSRKLYDDPQVVHFSVHVKRLK